MAKKFILAFFIPTLIAMIVIWYLVSVVGVDIANPPTVSQEDTTDTSLISDKNLDYFFEIALGSEYGSNVKLATKWVKPTVLVKVRGEMPEVAETCLNKTISDFNELSEGAHLVRTETDDYDILVDFAKIEDFAALDPNYVQGDYGFFWTEWDGDYEITSAHVLVGTNKMSENAQCHIVREELTQSMGFRNDSYAYPDSMFYAGWTEVTKYSQPDEAIIKLLYSDLISPKDTESIISKKIAQESE